MPASGLSATSGQTPLISRKLIFGNPQTTNVIISPDGQQIAFLRPVDGVLNLWVAPLSNPDAARNITSFTGRGIADQPAPRWASTGRDLLFFRDEGGNENYQLFSIPATGGSAVNLTRNGAVRTELLHLSRSLPEEIAVGFNDRDPRYHDVYRVDIHTGARRLVIEAGDMTEIMVDDAFLPKLAKRADGDGGYTYFRREGDQWTSAVKRPLDDMPGSRMIGTRGADEALLLDSGGSDKANLVALNLTSGATRTLAAGKKADIARVLTDARTGEPLAVAEEHLVRQWQAIDQSFAGDLNAIGRTVGGHFDIVSHSSDNSRWIIKSTHEGAPERYSYWDHATHRLTPLYSARPDLEGLALAKMRPVMIRAQDGLELTSYLSLPAGADADGDGIPDRALPLVLDVHGGPWRRDSLDFVPVHQWLANRGYAVLSINFRGSTGLGKSFVNAGNFEWAGKMHRDLIDGVQWAIKRGIADPDKVAIYGLSFGGYSALVGLTFTPKTFACAVDMSGPVNLVSTFQTTPPYWTVLRQQLKQRVGDVETEQGRKLLLSRSPDMIAERVERPLLIGQGANDPRVRQAEPDKMVAALKARNIPVTYMVYADEGHVLQRPENRISFFAAAEQFYGRCLGGGVEPINNDFNGANFTIVEGGDLLQRAK